LNVFLLSVAALSISSQAILKKSYNLRTNKKGAFFFSAVSVLCACLFFVLLGGFDLHFTPEVLPYAFGFALSYGTAVLSSLIAIRLGSLSLTSLISSYSLTIPTFYGLFFLGEEVGILFYIGLSVLFVSLFLINSRRSESKISLKWAIAVFLAFLGNGVCSTVQNAQQKSFGGQYKSETMIIALLTVGAVMLVFSLLLERKEIPKALKNGGAQACACGIMNGVCNLAVMILALRMNASIMFPIISACGILLTGTVSVLFYKEKLSRGQYVALLLGVISVIFMNI
jgi:drug/metabolite transporter (DMT)-like permease